MSEIKLFNQDCIVAMQQMDASSVDLIVTDPPYNLGIFMKNNPLYSKDIEQGFNLITESAKSGCIRAMYVLGNIYAGNYVQFGKFPCDLKEASKWLKLAVEHGDIYSMCALYNLSGNNRTYFLDDAERVQIHVKLKQLADSGKFYTTFYSKLCLKGICGFSKDAQLAWSYFKRALDCGYRISEEDINGDIKEICSQCPDLSNTILADINTLRNLN